MILSKREQYIVVAAIFAVTALVLDAYVLTPFLARRAKLQVQEQTLRGEIKQGEALIEREKLIAPRWQEMLSDGLEAERAQAESKILHALRDWSNECGLDLASLKPQQTKEKGSLLEMSMQMAGTGSMESVARFIWRVETASLPIKITQLQLGAREEGMDKLSLQLRISAVCLPARASVAITRKDDK